MKKNNKGFSLVELIIVIAIMAVLVGIFAASYMKYLEKGREAVDTANMEQAYISAQADYSHNDIVSGKKYYFVANCISESKPSKEYGVGTVNNAHVKYEYTCCEDGGYDGSKNYVGKIITIEVEDDGTGAPLIHIHWEDF